MGMKAEGTTGLGDLTQMRGRLPDLSEGAGKASLKVVKGGRYSRRESLSSKKPLRGDHPAEPSLTHWKRGGSHRDLLMKAGEGADLTMAMEDLT